MNLWALLRLWMIWLFRLLISALLFSSTKQYQQQKILDDTARDFGVVIQYGQGKTELLVVLRGKRKTQAIAILQADSVGEGLDATPSLPMYPGKCLRVVRAYKLWVRWPTRVQYEGLKLRQ